ncbi:stage II sporulation protein R [Calidifontibacillus erzurumensis]|uniref:Stage II sporulation protein R n=1 Tax=Calidifontibacillus erzurumensis TaxID=2741433 RepID=A0A8J8GDY6_9BACI|nr:stage II sporulation protein R [Calidifontibacillus erzurumensis]NSL52099.1 stage II sporulation protein R [Calidifontibacillus erzurumensis]
MTKRNQAIIFIILLLIGANLIQVFDRAIAEANGPVVIPDEAIRLRILANSNSDEDQALKRKVRDAVNAEITTWVEDLTSIEAARALIESRVDEIEEIAYEVLAEEGSNQTVQVEFGQVNFPTKIYGNYIYPAGQYEAILITLGEGEGANWWCVLFPPLCFLDFSNGDAVMEPGDEEEQDSEEEVEVKFFVIVLFEKLMDLF